MTANGDTSSKGESVTDASFDWEKFGRELLRSELELQGDAVRRAFFDLAQKIDQGEDPDRSDWMELGNELEQAYWLVEELGAAMEDVDEE